MRAHEAGSWQCRISTSLTDLPMPIILWTLTLKTFNTLCAAKLLRTLGLLQLHPDFTRLSPAIHLRLAIEEEVNQFVNCLEWCLATHVGSSCGMRIGRCAGWLTVVSKLPVLHTHNALGNARATRCRFNCRVKKFAELTVISITRIIIRVTIRIAIKGALANVLFLLSFNDVRVA